MITATIASLPGRLLSADEAAEYLSVSSRTLWTLARQGKVPCIRPTQRTVRYSLADLDAYIAASRSIAARPAEVANA